MTSDLTHRLQEAYRQTEYRVTEGDPFVLRVDEPCPELVGLVSRAFLPKVLPSRPQNRSAKPKSGTPSSGVVQMPCRDLSYS